LVERLLNSEIFLRLTDRLDGRLRWDRRRRLPAIVTLIGIRNRMRQRNLEDTGLPEADAELRRRAADPRYTSARTVDGTLNDLEQPRMGGKATRFGRNLPLAKTFPEPDEGLLSPSPRTVSLELMTREEFRPATTLNVLAAAWIQFEVHDWFSHGKDDARRVWKIALRDAKEWHEDPMKIPLAQRDPTSDDDPATPPTFLTEDSHWWDGSQIYGSKPEFATAIRSGENGKLRMAEDGLPPKELERALDLAGVDGNFWVGLGLLHTLFMHEHNAICDRLRREHRDWSDDQIFDKARLVNAALMAKIHTTEWTPAIIAHPTSRYALKATWSGIVGPRLGRHVGHLGKGDILSGIPGSKTDHHGVPYSLTEEFVAVYRMHPLLPDEYVFHSLDNGNAAPRELRFSDLDALKVRTRLEEIGMANALYSFGVAHPGQISLSNYPRSLQNLTRPNGDKLDLAAVDILRTRERGVPRYNEFRRLFRLKPAESFLELTGDPKVADHVREVYDGDIERVDLMVGLYAEPKPEGFGFSDTAFRVFILMASRRLKSDRFFTRDYTPEMYTRAGFDWVANNTMVDVLLRHYPSLYPALRGVQNAFAPWARVHER
jgi:Animal haem peroxidase